MLHKPFKPPLLKQTATPAVPKKQVVHEIISSDEEEPTPRPAKRRRHLVHIVDDEPKLPVSPPSPIQPALNVSRKPLLSVRNPTITAATTASDSNAPEGYYLVLW